MNHTTRKFPRTSREAFGLSPDEANPIQVFHQPLLQRLFFGFVRHGWILFVLALAVLVLSGCSVDNSAEWPESDNMQAIQQEESARASREFAGREVCGPGALAQWDGDVLSCFPKRGKNYQLAGATK